MFPEIVYRVPGQYRGQNGETFSYLGVNDADEMAAALADGWFRSIGEAQAAGKADAVLEEVEEAIEAMDSVSPATREELELRAKELGVSFNKRTADEVLVQRIAEAV